MTVLSAKDLKMVLQVSRDTAYALMRSQGFPSMKIGKRYFVTEAALERWLKDYEFKTYQLS